MLQATVDLGGGRAGAIAATSTASRNGGALIGGRKGDAAPGRLQPMLSGWLGPGEAPSSPTGARESACHRDQGAASHVSAGRRSGRGPLHTGLSPLSCPSASPSLLNPLPPTFSVPPLTSLLEFQSRCQLHSFSCAPRCPFFRPCDRLIVSILQNKRLRPADIPSLSKKNNQPPLPYH